MTFQSQKDLQNSGFLASDAAKKYENAENATLPFAKILIEKSGLANLDGEAHILDFACGIGAVIKALYDAVPLQKRKDLKVLGADVSPPMLDYLTARGEKEGWAGLTTMVVNGNTPIDLPPSSYSHIFVSFAIFIMPNILPQLHALLRPGGFIGITTWSYMPWQPLLHRSINLMENPPYSPSYEELQAKMFAGHNWGSGAYVVQKLEEAQFGHVDTVKEARTAQVGNPRVFMETMQFPLRMVMGFWEELQREGLLEELNEIMLKEITKDAGGEEGVVKMEFVANVAWGWKSDRSHD